VSWKIAKRAPFIKPENMDFQTGLAEVEAHERSLNYVKPSSRYER
jgi:yeast amino acid transporter